MVDFLIIGGGQSAGQKDILKLIIDGKIWFGVKEWWKRMYFTIPEYDDKKRSEDRNDTILVDGDRKIAVNIICWWTNLEHNKRRKLELKERYEEGKYEKFDYVDCINIDDVRDIPIDYYGLMAVPVTYIERWDRDEFDVIGLCNSGSGGLDKFSPVINGKQIYCRLLIRRKK